MRIAVISDTHNLLREEVLEQLKESDLILHAGDICSPEVYGAILSVGKPMLAVRGNNDGRWAKERGIPKAVDIYLSEIEGLCFDTRNLHIFMVHDRKDIPQKVLESNQDYDLVVFGHSHKYEKNQLGRTIFLNPGSCGPVRFRLPVTMALVEDKFVEVEIDPEKNPGKKFPVEFVTTEKIEPVSAEKSRQREVSPGEMKTLVTKVVKDIKRNKSAEYIAKKHKISLELAEQICRLYLTHPGVTVDGILGKMGM